MDRDRCTRPACASGRLYFGISPLVGKLRTRSRRARASVSAAKTLTWRTWCRPIRMRAREIRKCRPSSAVVHASSWPMPGSTPQPPAEMPGDHTHSSSMHWRPLLEHLGEDNVGSARTLYENFTLASAFQPIFSLSHQRLVGHEALLRASDSQGAAIPPPDMFDRCNGASARRDLDRACWEVHTRGFAPLQHLDDPQWLFLNIDASAFSPQLNSEGIRRCTAVA